EHLSICETTCLAQSGSQRCRDLVPRTTSRASLLRLRLELRRLFGGKDGRGWALCQRLRLCNSLKLIANNCHGRFNATMVQPKPKRLWQPRELERRVGQTARLT